MPPTHSTLWHTIRFNKSTRREKKAVVRAQGRLEITVNAEKFKELVRELLKAEGLEDVSDEMLEQAMGPTMAQFESMGQDIDENFGLIKEDGQWVICENE